MKKFLLLGFIFYLSGYSCFASEDIAVVDLGRIVENSNQVKQLKQEHSQKIADLDKIIINARGEISNESDPAKILMLATAASAIKDPPCGSTTTTGILSPYTWLFHPSG